MLDAYIIDRIQRERERARNTDMRPRIEAPRPNREPDPRDRRPDGKEDKPQERGVVIIDFNI